MAAPLPDQDSASEKREDGQQARDPREEPRRGTVRVAGGGAVGDCLPTQRSGRTLKLRTGRILRARQTLAPFRLSNRVCPMYSPPRTPAGSRRARCPCGTCTPLGGRGHLAASALGRTACADRWKQMKKRPASSSPKVGVVCELGVRSLPSRACRARNRETGCGLIEVQVDASNSMLGDGR